MATLSAGHSTSSLYGDLHCGKNVAGKQSFPPHKSSFILVYFLMKIILAALLTANILAFFVLSYFETVVFRTRFEFLLLIVVPILSSVVIRKSKFSQKNKLLLLIALLCGLMAAEYLGLSLREAIITPDGRTISQYGLRAIEFPIYFFLQLSLLPGVIFYKPGKTTQ